MIGIGFLFFETTCNFVKCLILILFILGFCGFAISETTPTRSMGNGLFFANFNHFSKLKYSNFHTKKPKSYFKALSGHIEENRDSKPMTYNLPNKDKTLKLQLFFRTWDFLKNLNILFQRF